MTFDCDTNPERFLESIIHNLERGITQTRINDIDVTLGANLGFSAAADDRVPKKNSQEIIEKERVAAAYDEQGLTHMAATEWEECANDHLWNCICGKCNISHSDIDKIQYFLSKSKQSWFVFSGNATLPSESKHAK